MSIELRRLAAAAWRAELPARRGFEVPTADDETAAALRALFGRSVSVVDATREIVADVRARGDAAVRDWTRRIDGVDNGDAKVDAAALARAWEETAVDVRDALTATAVRLRHVHAAQVDHANRGDDLAWLRPEPLQRVGCYVPGGRAAYPSTVLMSVIPAQLAGVGSIALASPPGADGRVHRLVLAAAHLLGIGEVHAIGGAQAVAALAFGTESIPAVDKVVGPGNLFVTLAKREVFGTVGIDLLAGPSEILVIASDGADAQLIAADLVSQLEHDPLAWAVCMTTSEALADAIAERFAAAAGSAVRASIIAAAAGSHAAVVVCATLDEAVDLAAAFAPEHLSLQGGDAEAMRDQVRNAGAVFCGALSPVSMGDYIAGPNHTLPTQGAARYRGPLSVMDFVRWPSVVELSRDAFEELAPAASTLARAEGLAGHEAAIRARLDALEAAR